MPRRAPPLIPAARGAVSLDERAVAQIRQRLADFGLRVHDDRAVPGDRLAQQAASTSRNRTPCSPA